MKRHYLAKKLLEENLVTNEKQKKKLYRKIFKQKALKSIARVSF